jgi:hypothetical protein
MRVFMYVATADRSSEVAAENHEGIAVASRGGTRPGGWGTSCA